MSDYIKREDAQRALVHTLKDAEIDTACNEQDWYCQGLMDAGVAIDAVPSADVVEVVRCKDCKYCENVIVAVTNSGEKTQRNICHRFKMAVDAKHFCSYGERKEREHE